MTRGWIIALLTVTSAVGLLTLALARISHVTRAHVQDRDRYAINFREITCDAPNGIERGDFLSEVQYVANLPSHLSIIGHELPGQIAEAFTRHPWVESVERVELSPPRSLAVHLKFRRPVLRVVHAGTAHAVDRDGIVLPASAVTDALPLHRGLVSAPAGPVGAAWGDPSVAAAARQAANASEK